MALSAWCFPTSGRRTGTPFSVSSTLPCPSTPQSSGRTSANASTPATTTRVATSRARRARSGGIVPTTASGTPSSNSTFSVSTPSSVPKPSTCPTETLVTTPCVGSMMSRSRAISPGTLAPASTTSASASSGAARIVSGTPTRLFRFPCVACALQRVPTTRATISFVAVLPLVPVTATTGPPISRRRSRASAPSATSVSSTANVARPAGASVPRCTTAPVAPRCTASARNAWPSYRSPARATNSMSGSSVRVSVPMPEKVRACDDSAPSAWATRALDQRVTRSPGRAALHARSRLRQMADVRCR